MEGSGGPRSPVSHRLTFCAAALLVLGPACRSSTGPPDPGGASYSVVYDPPRVVFATVNCDRSIPYAIISLGRGDFGLSINIIEDCSRSGGGFSFGEVLILGSYSVRDTTLSFVPEEARTPPFSGSFDASYVRITVPARTDSLAATPILVELGPRQPF